MKATSTTCEAWRSPDDEDRKLGVQELDLDDLTGRAVEYGAARRNQMPTDAEYIELVRQDGLAAFPPPLHALCDKIIDTKRYAEIRIWVHVFVRGYEHAQVTEATKLKVRFMHVFGQQLGGGGQFDYTQRTIPWNYVTSYINGYVTAPIIGDMLRILVIPEGLPSGPYDVFVTYYLV